MAPRAAMATRYDKGAAQDGGAAAAVTPGKQRLIAWWRAGERWRRQVGGWRTRQQVTRHDLAVFFRQLSALLLAGIPLFHALESLENQTEGRPFKALVIGLRCRLAGGASFSEALSAYPAVFDAFYSHMIAAGETGGLLGETCARLAGVLEAAVRLRRKLTSALSYVATVVCIAIGITTLTLLFLVPVFAEPFVEFDAELPAATRCLMAVSGGLRQHGLLFAVCAAVGAIAFNAWKQSRAGAYRLAALTLRLPVIGEMRRKTAASRFARAFAQLLKSGVPVLRALDIAAGAADNPVFERALKRARAHVEQGGSLSHALRCAACFPKLWLTMLATGEKTGKIEDMLQNIADFYEAEVTLIIERLMSLIEIPLLVFLGVVVGGIMLALFLPIVKLSEIVGRP